MAANPAPRSNPVSEAAWELNRIADDDGLSQADREDLRRMCALVARRAVEPWRAVIYRKKPWKACHNVMARYGDDT